MFRTSVRPAALALVFSVLLPGQPVGAEPHAPRRSLPQAGVLRPADAFEGDPREPATLVEAARRLLGPGWQALLLVGVGISSSPSRTAGGAGDLNGDGLEDVIAVAPGNTARTATVHGHRGTDGAELWSVPLSPVSSVFFRNAGDLTGDGVPDVLLLLARFDTTVACPVVGCVSRSDHEWTVRVLSGADGHSVWTRSYPGDTTTASAFAGAFVAVGGAFAYTVTNSVAVPSVSGDHDGDGLPDLVINAYDVTSAFPLVFALVLFGFGSAILVSTRAEVASGDTGSTLLARTQDYIPGGAALRAAGDAVAGPGGDLLWQTYTSVQGPYLCAFAIGLACAYASKASLDLDMIDGETLQTAWRARRDSPELEYAAAVPAGADLSGDGKSDLILTEATGPYVCVELFVADECGQPVRRGVISGSDGSVLWQRDGLGFLSVVGEVGGRPGADLVAVSGAGDACADPPEPLVLDRIDGATGETLFSTSFIPSLCGFAFVSTLSDADADAVREIVIQIFDFDATEARIESGRTGAEVFYAEFLTDAFLRPAGDVNADGKSDVYVETQEYDSAAHATTLGLSAVALPAGATLWSRAETLRGFSFPTFTVTRDQSGAGGDDLIYGRGTCCPSRSRIDSLEGSTGAVRWGMGDVI